MEQPNRRTEQLEELFCDFIIFLETLIYELYSVV